MEIFCKNEGIEFEICGKVIVAVSETELSSLESIYQRGRANGVRCEMIGQGKLKELEPHVSGIQALHVPDAGIVNYKKVCDRLEFRIKELGKNKIFFSRKVTSIKQNSQRITNFF